MMKVVIVPMTGDILATVATKDNVPEGEVIETPWTLQVQVKMIVQDDHLASTEEAKRMMTKGQHAKGCILRERTKIWEKGLIPNI